MSHPDTQFVLLHELLRAQRRAAVSRIASVIAHLIGTPLNVIAGRAALIKHGNSDPAAIKDNAVRIEQQVEDLAQRLRRLIQFLSPTSVNLAAVKIADVLEEVRELYEPIIRAQRIEFGVEESEEGASGVLVSSGLLELVASMLSLALSQAPPDSRASLRIEALDAEKPQTIDMIFFIPDFKTPSQRQIDRLEPPEEDDPGSVEALQVLAVCAASARQIGGSLRIEDHGDGNCWLRVSWPTAKPQQITAATVAQ